MSIDRVDIVRYEGVTASSREDPVVRALRAEFPGLRVGLWDPSRVQHQVERVITVALATWCGADFDPSELDGALTEAADGGSFVLRLHDVEEFGASAAEQVLTRCQRYVELRNGASRGPLFDEVLRLHRARHDLTKPLVRADYEHAIDTWRWVLRLDREAGAGVQIAALFHDIERLISEPDVRIEQHATDYQAFKDAHAAGGVELARETLRDVPLEPGVLDRALDLMRRHERPGDDPDLALLNDADGLSFFSLNSPGFLRYYGLAHTQRKVAYTLRRMRPSARWRLARVRLRSDIDAMVRLERADLEPQGWFGGIRPRGGNEPS